MVQKAFVLYWGYCHLATFVLLALLVSHRVWASRFSAAGSMIARLASSDWGAIDKLLIVLAIAHCAFYLFVPNFADYVEPLIPLLASNYLHGALVYADWHTGQAIVGSLYGPYVFLAQIPVLLWYPAIAASKLIGIGFGLAALLMLFLAVRNRAGSKDALAMCALMIALLSIEQHYWFWNRPDSILIAIVALAALLFDRARPAVCLAGLGLLAGVAIDLKIFGALYLLPLALACLPLVPSWSGLIGAVAIGGGLFVAALALPFEVGSFSLQNYIANIALVTHQGLIISTIRESLFCGLAILALPLLTWRALGAGREERVMAIALAVCTIFVAVVSGKPGGGPPYMMPLIPLALYLAARLSCREGVAQRSVTTKTRRLVLCAVLIGAAPIWAYSWRSAQSCARFSRLSLNRRWGTTQAWMASRTSFTGSRGRSSAKSRASTTSTLPISTLRVWKVRSSIRCSSSVACRAGFCRAKAAAFSVVFLVAVRFWTRALSSASMPITNLPSNLNSTRSGAAASLRMPRPPLASG